MSHSTAEQMDAIVIQAFGPPAESLAVRLEPVPEVGPGEALVEIHAAGINPFDPVSALGFLAALTPPPPLTPGLDYAGVVVSDGDHIGQEVWGSATELGLKRPGTHARFVVVPETWLSRKPARLTMTEAAAVGHPYLAAWEAVIERGQLMPGETLLITGGSGLVGQAATAIARWRGAVPIVASRRRPDGVEHFIDTSSSDLHQAVLELTDGRGADMALDAVGGELFEPVLRSVRFGGRLTGLRTYDPQVTFALDEIYSREVHVTGLATVFLDGAHVARAFDQLRVLFDSGLLAPPAVKTCPLEQSAEAYQTVLDGQAGIRQVLLPNGGLAVASGGSR
jgi:NADPH:quinone reductase-like Zn-dependent oxidoreductase